MAKRCSDYLKKLSNKVEAMANSSAITENDGKYLVKLSNETNEERANCPSYWNQEEQNRFARASTCGQYMAMGPSMIKECLSKVGEE